MHKMIALLVLVSVLLSPAFITNAAADNGGHVLCDTEIIEVPTDDEMDQAELTAMGDYGGNLTGATWYWPLHGYSSATAAYSMITSSYGHRGSPYNGDHRGVDIGAAKGTPVFPVRIGTVSQIHSSTDGSYGRYIVINHNDGYFSVYMHLSSINVSKGQSVNVNTQIGAVGGSGNNSETGYAYHLHLGLHYGNAFSFVCSVNPCPPGYERRGSSLQASAGGYPVGTPTISYVIRAEDLTSSAADLGDDFYAWLHYAEGSLNVAYTDDGIRTAYQDGVDPRQVWHFTRMGDDNSYRITNLFSNLCLGANYYDGKSGTVDGEIYGGYDSQRWRFYHIPDKDPWLFTIKPVQFDTVCLDVYNTLTTPTSVQLYEAWNGPAQIFAYTILPDEYLEANIANLPSTPEPEPDPEPEPEPTPSVPTTASTVTQYGNTYRVETQLKDCSEPCQLFVAGYKGGQFVTLKVVPGQARGVSCTLQGDIDEIKVLLLDSTTLGPLCENEDIPSGKWR